MKSNLRTLFLVSSLACSLFLRAQVPLLNSYASAPATIFLDFDGHSVDGTSWNWSGAPIVCAAAALNTAQMTEIFNRVAEDYRPFNLNVTTDSTRFLAAPANQRMRVIITPTSAWYGNSAGGVAFISSFTWGDDHPCFVFSALLGNNAKKIAEAASHESGHTLGLYHQSAYDSVCAKLSDYNGGSGTGEIGWAPIMGVGYNHNLTLWANGPNSFGCTSYQSDLEVITSSSNGFGYRADDHSDSIATATSAVFTNGQFNITGVIQRNADQDLFRFTVADKQRFRLTATPYNVGADNAGSDLDLQITLLNDSNHIIGVYNPDVLLSAVADTTLNAGTYFLRVEGKGNAFAPDYASLGAYSLIGNIEGGVTLPILRVRLHGLQLIRQHKLDWEIDADERVTAQTLEVSSGKGPFTTLAAFDTVERSFDYATIDTTTRQYRMKVEFADGHLLYSNVISLTDNQVVHRPALLGNLINSGTVLVNSPGNYRYEVFALSGKGISHGQLLNGINNLQIGALLPGIYFIRFFDNNNHWTEKLVRQ